MTTGTRLFALTGATIAASMLVLLGSATAAPGDLDSSFGSDGVVETPIGDSSGPATGVVTQPDGKIIVGGGSSQGSTLIRYLPNGALDGSFGTGGIATGPMTGAESLATQPDGKLLLGGWTSGRGLSVARYNPDGGLDTSFGSQGVAHGPGGDATGIAVQADGRIVAVGTIHEQDNADSFMMTRFMGDGTLDVGFGTNGSVRTRIGGSSEPGSVLLQPDGKIVVAGTSSSAYYAYDGVAAITRYETDGALDPSFGSGGTVRTTLAASSYRGPRMARQPDGQLVVVGSSGLGRYTSDGSPDQSFGSGGTTTAPFGTADVRVQVDGRIVVAGSGPGTFAVARFEPNGSLDGSFGEAGIAATSFGWFASANALALQPDGRIVAAGLAAGPSGAYQFAVARFLVTTPSSIAAQPLYVDYGQPTRLNGTLTTRQPGPLTLLRRGCYDFSQGVQTPTISAGADGVWAMRVQPRSRTTYWAAVGVDRSVPLTVSVRPLLSIKRISSSLVRARVLFGHSLSGETVVLQRRSGLGWFDLRHGALRRIARGRAGVVSGVTFRLNRRAGRQIRLWLPQSNTYDCFAEARSSAIRG